MSWFRKSSQKHSPPSQIQVQTNNNPSQQLHRSPSSTFLASPVSAAHHAPPPSSYPNSPRSAGLPSTSSNGFLEPSYQPQNRKESAPARLVSASYSYDGPTAPGPSTQQPRKDVRGKHKEATSPSITFSGFLGLGGSKSKKPSASSYQGSDVGGRQVRSNPGIEVVDPDMDVRQEETRPTGRPRAGTYDPSSSSPPGNRNRAYTLSGSTATSTNLTVPVTPATSYEGDGYSGGRGRSNSGASSTAASVSRKGKQPPSLRAVEEYDPFAAGGTNSFYYAPTPPTMTPDSQFFEQPDPQYIRKGGPHYVDGMFERNGPPNNPNVINTLKIPQRPTVQIPPQPGVASRKGLSPTASNPVSPGATSKKQPLLPFRSKSTREKKPAAEEPESHSGFIGGLLRPNSNRQSATSAVSAPSDVSRSGSVVERSKLLYSPQGGRSPQHLPISIGNSPVDFKRPLASPAPSIISSNHDAPSIREGGAHNSAERTPSEMSYMPTTASTPATSPSQPSSNGHPSRPLSNGSVSSMNSKRRRRLRAALAVSVQDIDTSPLTQKGGEYDISDVRIEVDVSGLSPASSISVSKGKERSLGLESPIDDEKRPRASPVVGEEGAFEFLLPPKSPAVRISKPAKDSPQYGAPSFIEEGGTSPGDHYFFASPYPSGVTTVPVFRDSMDLPRDSEERIRPPEAHLPLHPPKVSIDVAPGDPAAATVADAFLPPTPSIISDFPSVPDLFRDIEVLMSGATLSPIPSPARTITAASPRPPPPLRAPPLSPIDPELLPVPAVPSPSSSRSTDPSPSPKLTPNATPLNIPEKTTTSSLALTVPPAEPPRSQLPPPPPVQPFPPRSPSPELKPEPTSEPEPVVREPTKLAPLAPPLMSPTFSDSMVSPIEYRPNPIMGNPAAGASTLSFSSMSSAGGARSKSRQQDEDAVDEESDEDEDDVADLRSRESSRRRRGSEPASPRPRVGMDDMPMGTSFGAFGTYQSMLSSPPPSAFPAGLKGVATSRKKSIPSPSSSSSNLYQRTRSPSTGSMRGRNLYAFMANLAASSTSMSEDGCFSGSVSSGGRGTPNGAASPPGPKRMRSLTHIPMPAIPSLRHYNSFNPSSQTAGESSTPPPSSGASNAQKVIHTSASTSNLSMASSAKTEVGPARKPSSSKRSLLRQSSKTSVNNSRPSTAGSISIGPLGETVDFEHDWSRHRARFPTDDDNRSLVTLNCRIDSLDGHVESADEVPWAYSESVTGSGGPASTKSGATKATKTTSPSKSDFAAPMHILPPSELLRFGDAPEKGSDSMSTRARTFSETDSLLHGDCDDVGSTLRDPEGSNWLSDVGIYAGASSNSKTASVMPIYEGRGFVGIAPPLRGFQRPSTSSRRDSSMSKSSSMTGSSRRPSTSQVSSSNSSGARTPGGPLSPPPPRSRLLPRPSISSSIRSFGNNGFPLPTPLAPPPSRSRANSSSEASQRENGKPPLPSAYPRRGSEFSVLSVSSSSSGLPLLPADTRPPEKAKVTRNSSLMGMSALRKKRQSLKPSFLDIEFDDEFEEEDEVDTRTLNGATVRDSLDDSFLDLGRGASMESTRDFGF